MIAAIAVLVGAMATGAPEGRFQALARAQGGVLRLAPSSKAEGPVPDRAPGPVLDVGTLRTLLGAKAASLNPCAADGTRRFVLDLAVQANGRLRDLRVASEPAEPDLQACVRRVVFRWRFPTFSGETPDGRTVEVVNLSVPVELAGR